MTRIALGLAVFGGCAGDDGGSSASGDPTFAEINDAILMPACGFSVCHGSGTGGLTIDADAYDALVDVESFGAPGQILVIAGDPDNSYLVHKLEGADDIIGDPMPPPTGNLGADDLAAIRAWIAAGAAP